jgi:hypothetical protein
MRFVRAAIDAVRLILAREVLEEVPAPAPRPERAPRRFLRLLLAIEPLPLDPPAPRRRRAFLGALFAPEPLPHDPVSAAPRRRSRLWALFALERLDDSLP